MLDLTNKTYVFTLVDTQKTKSGGYIPCIVIDGEKGYRPMSGQGEFAVPWDWGKDRDVAQKLCDERNEKMGFSKTEAMKVIIRSMF